MNARQEPEGNHAVADGFALPQTAPRPHGAASLRTIKRRREYVLLAATVLLSLGIMEGLTRLLVPSPLPWNWPQVRYDVSPSLGFRLKPNQTGYTADKPVRTNALGLRGPDRLRIKPPGVRRTLVLGDSIAFGHGVSYEDSFVHRLETLLNTSTGAGSNEVIGAGVPAYNTQQEVTYFRHEGILLQPDVAVLALYWNDVSSKAGVTADSEGRLIDDATPVNHGWYGRWSETPGGFWARNVLKRSNFLYFVVDRLRYLRAGSARSTPKQAAMQDSVLTGAAHQAVTAGWEDIERQLRILADLCRSLGIELVVAILPMPQLLAGQYPNAQYPSRVIGICAQAGLRCIDIQPAFARAFEGHGSLFIPYDGDHPNERGHEVIAREIYAALRESRTP